MEFGNRGSDSRIGLAVFHTAQTQLRGDEKLLEMIVEETREPDTLLVFSPGQIDGQLLYLAGSLVGQRRSLLDSLLKRLVERLQGGHFKVGEGGYRRLERFVNVKAECHGLRRRQATVKAGFEML